MKEVENARRRFLKEGLALAALPLAGVPLALGQTAGATDSFSSDQIKAYGERSRFVTSKRIEFNHQTGEQDRAPFGLSGHLQSPLQDSMGSITPNALHYVSSHGDISVPFIDPKEHRLMIDGMVDRPLLFTMDELKRLPPVSRVHYLECNANYPKASNKTVQETTGLTSCAQWTGVPVSLLLKQAGVQKGAKWLLAEAADDSQGMYSIPIERAMDDYCMVAYGQNGEPVRPQNGYPIRLLVPGLEAVNSVKWLRRLKVTDQFYVTYMNHGRYTGVTPKLVETQFEQGPKSVITAPSGGQQLPGPGHYEITGLAWSGAGNVRQVDISLDGGKTWKEAQIQSEVHKIAHVRFGMSWDWAGEEHVLVSRCTDEKGQIQPTQAEFNSLWTGNSRGYAHPNFMIPWKLGRDGRLQNGLA